MAGVSIYLLSSHIGRLYIGVTSKRVTQHKEGALEGFTARENSA
jgi:predicted GIY-YIG superfamily endonuclease